MVRFLILGAALAIVSARAELQLSPSIAEYELEGAKFKQLAFRDGDKNATYQPPRGWEYSGSATELILRPPGKTQAEARITRLSRTEPAGFDDETLKKFTANIAALAPQGSSAVTIVSQEKNPLRISGKETFQLVLSYTLFGQVYNRSILFLNREHDQIRFQLVAREADFTQLQRAFQASLYTWSNL